MKFYFWLWVYSWTTHAHSCRTEIFVVMSLINLILCFRVRQIQYWQAVAHCWVGKVEVTATSVTTIMWITEASFIVVVLPLFLANHLLGVMASHIWHPNLLALPLISPVNHHHHLRNKLWMAHCEIQTDLLWLVHTVCVCHDHHLLLRHRVFLFHQQQRI